MINKSIIATDIDGTLLDCTRRISERTSKIFYKLFALGEVEVVLASSRMPTSLNNIAAQLGIPCHYVAYDGALIIPRIGSQDNFFQKNITIPVESLEKLGLLSSEIDYVGFYYNNEWVCNTENYWSLREERNTGLCALVDPEIVRTYAMRFRDTGIHKVMIRGEADLIDALRIKLVRSEVVGIKAYGNSRTILEILPGGAEKGCALRRLVAHLGIKQEKVIVFGDGLNDISMFQAFQQTVAVGNAKTELKKIAHLHTDDGENDGVAKFLEERFSYKS